MTGRKRLWKSRCKSDVNCALVKLGVKRQELVHTFGISKENDVPIGNNEFHECLQRWIVAAG